MELVGFSQNRSQEQLEFEDRLDVVKILEDGPIFVLTRFGCLLFSIIPATPPDML